MIYFHPFFEYMIPAIRIGFAIWCLPLTGEVFTSNKLKITLTIALSITAAPLIWEGEDYNEAFILTEASIGLLYGLSVRFAVLILQISGEIVSNLVSLAFPIPDANGGNRTVLSKILVLSGTFLLCLHNAPSMFIMRISINDISSIENIYFSHLFKRIINSLSDIMLIASSLTSKILILSLMLNIGIGYCSKTASTLPITLISIPLSIFLGIAYLSANHQNTITEWTYFVWRHIP